MKGGVQMKLLDVQRRSSNENVKGSESKRKERLFDGLH